MAMDKEYAYKALAREFESTLINELMPGVLHNFANPLNGIMGRSKLLQRRMDEYFKKIKLHYPNLIEEISNEEDKLSKDVNSICNESDRFFYMFQDLASKFYAIADIRFEQINLTNLIENEIRFLEFYLDFKHEIKKNIKLISNLPNIYGVHSDYSHCLSALFRNSMYRMKKSNKKELSVETDYQDNVIRVVIQDTGEKPSDNFPSAECHADSLASVKMLFKECGVNCVFESLSDVNRITIEIPANKES